MHFNCIQRRITYLFTVHFFVEFRSKSLIEPQDRSRSLNKMSRSNLSACRMWQLPWNKMQPRCACTVAYKFPYHACDCSITSAVTMTHLIFTDIPDHSAHSLFPTTLRMMMQISVMPGNVVLDHGYSHVNAKQTWTMNCFVRASRPQLNQDLDSVIEI